MSSQKLSAVVRWSSALGFIIVISGNSASYGQSDAYKKPSSKRASPAESVALPGAPTPENAKGGQDTAPGAAGAKTAQAPEKQTDKVDIGDLEAKYWAPKDTEFNVVQNRLYTKAKRVSATISYGSLLNDTYASGSLAGLALNYYFTEKTGIEFCYEKFQVNPNTLVQNFANQNGAVPNYNLLNSYYGVAFNWIPFYGKMSVLDKKIIYFDLSINPGIGLTNYQQQHLSGASSNLGGVTAALDISQHFFLNQNWALRMDLKNHLYQESVVGYKDNSAIQTQQTWSTTLSLGVSYYF